MQPGIVLIVATDRGSRWRQAVTREAAVSSAARALLHCATFRLAVEVWRGAELDYDIESGAAVALTRRSLMKAAAAIGATGLWARGADARARWPWKENRQLYPQGVASGDPRADSVILWTRRPSDGPIPLQVEVAEDEAFEKIAARATVNTEAVSDWTVRVLIGGLKPAHVYWYRFSDQEGGSRVGRTITAPGNADDRPVQFAFVSCQDVTQGAQNAYRRMIWEDERADAADRLGFVLHLGDFIYEIVWYPEDRATSYDRRVRDVVRYPNGQKVRDFHVPTDLEDYRHAYRGYLTDPDLQDARARWPFVAMWDNHEFSWNGWQSLQNFGKGDVPAQTRKVAANQARFEYHPARLGHGGKVPSTFSAPSVKDAVIEKFDPAGIGDEPNNRAAINSLIGYRTLRWGANVELIIADQHSFRSREPTGRPEAANLTSDDFPDMMAEELMQALDAGATANGGSPQVNLSFGSATVPNFRKDGPAQSILGARQKSWMLDKLKASHARWKLWAVSQGVLDWRADPQNIPAGIGAKWPGVGYAGFGGGDHGAAYAERADIYDFVQRKRISGFASIAGDRHSFWAGLTSKELPPGRFDPMGVSFVTGSISAPGLVEAYEHRFPKAHALRALYLADRSSGKPEPAINMLLRHGVRSCLEYAQTRDIGKALAKTNPDNAPHLSFVDMGGHGYAVVTATSDALRCDFVCIPRPVERSVTPDGGPLRYRVRHEVQMWEPGEMPKMEKTILEGDVGLSA